MSRRAVPKLSELRPSQGLQWSNVHAFRVTFPEVSDLTLKIESDIGHSSFEHRSCVYTMASPPGSYFDCTHSDCYGGAFSIVELLRHAVANRDSELTLTKHCEGYEGTPSGIRRRSCIHSYEVTLRVAYVDRLTPPAGQ